MSDNLIISADSLLKKYPRFFQSISISNKDISAYKSRSDIWCVRLIEQIYDEATIECSKFVSPDRRRMRCGLYLGALDAFPLVAERFLANQYSVLEIRRRITLDLIISVLKAIDIESRIQGSVSTSFHPASSRAIMFSKFLSEEWDVDYLAIFLHYRSNIQTYCKFKFADLAAPHAAESDQNDTTSTTTGNNNTIKEKSNKKNKTKKTPLKTQNKIRVELPELICNMQRKSLYFLDELAFPKAPLVAFDISILPSICLLFLPRASLQVRTYFADKILEFSSIQVQAALKAVVAQLNDHTDRADRIGFKVNGVVVIPVYLVFYVLCLEWDAIKKNDVSILQKVKEVNESLRKLNNIYDQDCLLIKSIKKDTKKYEIELSKCNNEILKLEKAKRRLERKWEDNLASEEEREELVNLRVLETKLKNEKLSLESSLKSHNSLENNFDKKIENLWDTVLQSQDISHLQDSSSSDLKSEEKFTEQWREEVLNLVIECLTANEKARFMNISTSKSVTSVNIAESESPGISIETPEEEEKEEIMMSIEDRVLALEREALSIMPPPVFMTGPDYPVDVEADERVLGEEPTSQQQVLLSEDLLETEIEIEIEIEKNRLAEEVKETKRLIEERIAEDKERHQTLEKNRFEEEAKETKRLSEEREAQDKERQQMLSEELLVKNHLAQEAKETKRLIEEKASEDKERQQMLSEELIEKVRLVKEANLLIEERISEENERQQMIAEEIIEKNRLEKEAKRLSQEKASEDKARQQMLLEEMLIKYCLAEEAKEAKRLIEERLAEEKESQQMLLEEMLEKDRLAQEANETKRLIEERISEDKERQQMLLEEMLVKYHLAEEAKEAKRLIEERLAEEKERQQMLLEEILEKDRLTQEAKEAKRLSEERASEDKERQQMSSEELLEKDRLMQIKKEEELQIILQNEKLKEILENEMKILMEKEALLALKLSDPWRSLDDDPETWLSAKTLQNVNKKYKRCKNRWTRDWKNEIFKRLKNNLKVSQNIKSNLSRIKSNIFNTFKNILEESRLKKLQHKSALRIQVNIRCYLRLKKLNNLILINKNNDALAAQHYSMKLKKSTREMFGFLGFLTWRSRRDLIAVRHITERRLLVSWYHWCLVKKRFADTRIALLKKRLDAAITIQCFVRVKIAQRKFRIKLSQLRIILASKVFLARNKFRKQSLYMKRLFEYQSYTIKQREIYNQKRFLNTWKKYFNFSIGIKKIFLVISKRKTGKRFAKLAKITALYRQKYRKSIIKIQSVLRMGSVKTYCLNYYKWKRGLCKLQGLIRRHIAMSAFFWVLRDFRAAQRIQKHFRGFNIRSQFFDSRIRAIHYAASHNNYDKLLYFANKFPELLNELDKDGNTALHNAAKNASRRTLKLLLKKKLDPNMLNLAGYTPLHLVIMSKAINRDDCCLYMLDRGFDEDIRTPDGKSCLLLACENGRALIVKQLLANGQDPNTPDNNGGTCLQTACSNGYLAIVRDLLEYGADSNSPGRIGTCPLHDVVNSSNIDIVNLLFSHGAYINTFEPYNFQTPLMWACQAGTVDIVRTYLLQGADVRAKDINNWTAIHYATFSDSKPMFELLRDADVNFDAVNNHGETPLHIAVQNNCLVFVQAMLEACAYPSVQNLDGDQPLHIAARQNNVPAMKLLCLYDQHVGRVNYAHQTPLGVAKFHGCLEAAAFLEKHYVYLESDIVRDANGDIWWDKEIDHKLEGWHLEITQTGERVYISDVSGEVTASPPKMSADEIAKISSNISKPIRRKVEMVSEENTITMHQYKLEYKDTNKDVSELAAIYDAATIINKYVRRKSAYIAHKREKQKHNIIKRMKRFIREYYPPFKARMLRKKEKGVIKLQGVVRGIQKRAKYFLPGGEHSKRWIQKSKKVLARKVWTWWKRYKARKAIRMLVIVASMPKTIEGWDKVILKARKPNRIIGIIEEYIYPGTIDIKFYRNTITRVCSPVKPEEILAHDKTNYKEVELLTSVGYTPKQVMLAVTLQAIWRGYHTRSYHKNVSIALKVALRAESDYFREPDVDHHLWNYALHCQVVVHDIERARRLYMEALSRMQFAGPDQAFILYAYAIFAFVTHDLDQIDIVLLLERARRAEADRENKIRITKGEKESQALIKGTYTYGKIFVPADLGFFRVQAMSKGGALAWHNYAACRYLIFNDFPGSFDAFLDGFRCNAKDKAMKANFDIMMQHFHGTDKEKLAEIVKERMRVHAARDNEFNNTRQLKRELGVRRLNAAVVIKRWYKERRSARTFNKFIAAIKVFKEENLNNKRAQKK